jgi:hypothetical protein
MFSLVNQSSVATGRGLVTISRPSRKYETDRYMLPYPSSQQVRYLGPGVLILIPDNIVDHECGERGYRWGRRVVPSTLPGEPIIQGSPVVELNGSSEDLGDAAKGQLYVRGAKALGSFEQGNHQWEGW